jgi:hypothetical protein
MVTVSPFPVLESGSAPTLPMSLTPTETTILLDAILAKGGFDDYEVETGSTISLGRIENVEKVFGEWHLQIRNRDGSFWISVHNITRLQKHHARKDAHA